MTLLVVLCGSLILYSAVVATDGVPLSQFYTDTDDPIFMESQDVDGSSCFHTFIQRPLPFNISNTLVTNLDINFFRVSTT